MFQCGNCHLIFSDFDSMNQHEKTHEKDNSFQSSDVWEPELYSDLESMDWSQVTLTSADDLLGAIHSSDFHDIAESTFHGDRSLLESMDVFECDDTPGPSIIGDSTVQVGGGREDFNIRLLNEKDLKTMGVKQVSYELTFNDRLFREGKKMNEVLDLLKEAFQKMLDRVKTDLRPGDIVRMAIHNEGLDIPVFVPFRPMQDMNADTVLETLTRVLNSNESVVFDSACRVDVGAIKYPRGGRGITKSTLALKITSKRSIVNIINNDNTCLVRATLVALASCSKVHPDEYRRFQTQHPTFTAGHNLVRFGVCPIWYYKDLQHNHKRVQDRLTHQVCKDLGFSLNEPLTYACIPRLEEFLNANIYIVSAGRGDKFSYVSAHHDEERKRVFLYHDDTGENEHFHAISNITGFFTRSYFCQHCLVPFNLRYRHNCQTHCGVCQSDNCRKEEELTCSDCYQTCRSQACYRRHKTRTAKGIVPCQTVYKCLVCLQTFHVSERKREDHRCGHYTCKSCQQYVEPEHLCYTRAHLASPPETRRYIFADIESSQQDEILQCEFGYAPAPDSECVNCRNRSCPSCRLCRHCEKSHCGQAKHSFVLAVCQTACSNCGGEDLTADSKCPQCGDRCQNCSAIDKKTKKYLSPPCPGTCGGRERVFETLVDLGIWMFSDLHKGFTVFFHNLSYDGSFLLQYLISQTIRPSFIIYRGSKIQMFTVSQMNIRVLDSFNFLPMALAKLPKAFQLDSLKKGYFPHFFTSLANSTYIGPYPPADTYGPDSMSVKDRKAFYHWYDSQVASGTVFDFRKEMLEYCRSDVDILRRACLKFKNLLWEATSGNGGQGVDAFQSCTIASLCMDVFKTKFLPEDGQILVQDGDEEHWLPQRRLDGQRTVSYRGSWIPLEQLDLQVKGEQFVSSPIAQPPPKGYHSHVNFSKKSIAWLEWLRHSAQIAGRDLNIRHALTGRGEYRVPGTRYSIDGYLEPDLQNPGGVAYEFHGCRYHGCPVCYKNPNDVLVPNSGQKASGLLALTRHKERRLRELGLKVIVCWEHEFDALLRSNSEARAFVDNLDLEDRLDPRDSLMGGRTNGCTLYKRTNRDTKIYYMDFTSLYPFVNKTAVYPVGHPEIITREFKELSSYFGLAKVKVSPPRGLFHPVLGNRTGGKLTFPLCRTCVERQQQDPCTCGENERSWIGTYCTPELKKAMEKGYKINKIYEVYHWQTTAQYDPESQTGGLFASYINLFLKIKQEASGRPVWVKTDEDLNRYVEMYEAREGIRLDPERVSRNEGLRSLAKLLLNSFWGKFGQRQNLTKTQFLHDSEAHVLFRQMADPTVEIVDFQIVDDSNLMLSTQRVNEEMCLPGHTNVFLASFTTCWARLKLYELLDRLQRRVLYWDTDSVIFTSMDGEWQPPLGDYLGELTNELDEGDWIVEFVCNGPKNYAYRTHDGKTVCKVKGFSLNYVNSERLNLDSMKDAMFNRNDPFAGKYRTVNPHKICREKIHSELYSREEIKDYSSVYTKRVVQSDLTTLPYGY